jgi:hypothetical protein
MLDAISALPQGPRRASRRIGELIDTIRNRLKVPSRCNCGLD